MRQFSIFPTSLKLRGTSGNFQFSKYLAAVLFLLMMPLAAGAQNSGLLPDCNPIPGNGDSCGVQHLFELAVNIYNFALGLAALVAFLFIIIGGVRLLVAYYGEGDQNVSAAKATLRNGIVGFIIVLAAYLIVQTLLNLLGVDDVDQYFDGSVFNAN